jgi:myo-inositol-1(or 4)-monophosphatase
MLVVIDPIDGSVNAKRGLPHHALSIAVAEGSTMADVVFGFVQDFGPDEEWVAWRGRGAELDGRRLDA